MKDCGFGIIYTYPCKTTTYTQTYGKQKYILIYTNHRHKNMPLYFLLQYLTIPVLMDDKIEERIKYDYHQLLFYSIHIQLQTVNHNSSVNF